MNLHSEYDSVIYLVFVGKRLQLLIYYIQYSSGIFHSSQAVLDLTSANTSVSVFCFTLSVTADILASSTLQRNLEIFH